jgi:hypothetical protein
LINSNKKLAALTRGLGQVPCVGYRTGPSALG